MKRLAILILFLAVAVFPLCAQNIANPSFEAPATLNLGNANGPWNTGPIPSWTISGGAAGLWQVVGINEFASVPDGTTIAYSNGGKISQDLGVAATANTIYTFTVWTGRRSDQWQTPTNSYTVSLSAGTTILCTQSAQLSTIPVGTFTKQVLTCPVTAALAGNLSIMLGCNGPQCAFDNLSLAAKSTAAPQPLSITVKAMLLWCTLCDQTDNVPVTGNLVIAQLGGPTSTYNLLSNGSVSASSMIDAAQDPLQFTLMLTDSAGVAQPGANLTLTFPRFELASPGFTLGTISLGVVRLAHTTDSQGNPAVRIVDVSQFSLGK